MTALHTSQCASPRKSVSCAGMACGKDAVTIFAGTSLWARATRAIVVSVLYIADP